MPKKNCRYDPKHKFDTEEEQLDHEAKCPSRKKRIDLKECPFTRRHIVTTKQYENHIKKCKFRPKTVKKEEIIENNENSNKDNNNGTTQNDNKTQNQNQNDWDALDNWGDENNEKTKEKDDLKKNQVFKYDVSDSQSDAFEEEDFIFKQCYI